MMQIRKLVLAIARSAGRLFRIESKMERFLDHLSNLKNGISAIDKLNDAHEIIIQITEENQSLKVRAFELERKLRLLDESVETMWSNPRAPRIYDDNNPNHLMGDHFERKHLSIAYYLISDFLLQKCDFDLAHRVLIQAEAINPFDNIASDRASKIIKKTNDMKACPSVKANAKFDFLFVSTSGGVTAFQTLISAHPELLAVPKEEFDDALFKGTENVMREKYAQIRSGASAHLKFGLVQHALVAGTTGPPEIAKRIRDVMTNERFIHGVREPLEASASITTHHLISEHLGAHSFEFMFQGSPFAGSTQSLDNFPTEQLLSTDLKPSSIEIARDTIECTRQKSVDMIKHYRVGSTYAEHFDEWRPISLARGGGIGEEIPLQRFFEEIEVSNATFENPLFHHLIGNQLHSVMASNTVTLEIAGQNLMVGLDFAHRALFSHTYPVIEIAWAAPDPYFDKFRANRATLAMTCNADQWLGLSRKLRMNLIESGVLSKFLSESLIPVWVRYHNAWKREIDKRTAGVFDIEHFPDENREDLMKFIEAHPKFETIWASTLSKLKLQ